MFSFSVSLTHSLSISIWFARSLGRSEFSICTYIRIHPSWHTFMHIHTHIHTHIHKHVCMYVFQHPFCACKITVCPTRWMCVCLLCRSFSPWCHAFSVAVGRSVAKLFSILGCAVLSPCPFSCVLHVSYGQATKRSMDLRGSSPCALGRWPGAAETSGPSEIHAERIRLSR